MWLILLAAHLLFAAQAQFVPNDNCPHPIYATQADVAPWVGITVDTTQKVEIVNGLNLFKCKPGTLFFYIINGVLTRQNWWLACGSNLKTGWRVRDAGSRNTAYGMIPVGCAKPTCTGLQLFDGNEYILRGYSNYEVIPTEPLFVTNGKFQVFCPAGSVLGYADSATTLVIQPGMSVFCEAQGWWLKTSATSTGSLLSSRVGCFKQIAEPVLPTVCQTGITYFAGSEQILKDNSQYALTTDRAAAVSGKWKLNCPSDGGIGYAESGLKFTFAAAATISCDSYGWWLITSSNPSGSVFSPDVKVGCFRKDISPIPVPTGFTTPPPPAPAAKPANMGCGCWYEFSACPTCNWQKMFVLDGFGADSGKCTLGCASGHVFEGGSVNLLSCQGGYWFGSSSVSVNDPIHVEEYPITISCVPSPIAAKCSVQYSTFACEGCDSSKIIPLQSAKSSSGCVLSCDKDYRLMVLDSTGAVTRVQEVVVENTFFQAYPLGKVNETIKMSWSGAKFSCELATINTNPVKVIEMGVTTLPPPAPAAKPENMGCGCWYEFSACPTCNWQKMFVLDGFGGDSKKCTLGCASGYVFEGGMSNMLSCQGGYWFGSSSITVTGAVTMKGYPITTSCVPAPTQPKCALTYSTFNCEGCDSAKIIPLQSAKSTSGCVLSCDKGYRILVLESTGAVSRAQEVVVEGTSILAYPLGKVNETIRMDWEGAKFSCEPATANAIPVKIIGVTVPGSCPPIKAWDLAECRSKDFMGDPCQVATQTTNSIYCPPVAARNYLLWGGKSEHPLPILSISCDSASGGWRFEDSWNNRILTQTQLEQIVGSNLVIACADRKK